MNTTAAATQANVTVATIRTWCRQGVIAAVKTAGRWIIDTASLAWRIALPKALHPAKTVAFTIENMVAIGGSRWTKAGHDRVYINNWAALAGLWTDHYKSGNISSASYQGDHISNSDAYKIGGCIEKLWFDAADGKLHCRYGFTHPRIGRQQIWADTVTGIRAAITAL
jgi:hypothetical protein